MSLEGVWFLSWVRFRPGLAVISVGTRVHYRVAPHEENIMGREEQTSGEPEEHEEMTR